MKRIDPLSNARLKAPSASSQDHFIESTLAALRSAEYFSRMACKACLEHPKAVREQKRQCAELLKQILENIK